MGQCPETPFNDDDDDTAQHVYYNITTTIGTGVLLGGPLRGVKGGREGLQTCINDYRNTLLRNCNRAPPLGSG